MPGYTRDLRDRAGGYGGRRPIQGRWSHPLDPRVKRERSFPTKREAKAWMAAQDTDALRGGWVDPNEGKLTFEAVAEDWLASRVNIGPRTLGGYTSVLHRHLMPEFGSRRIASIDATDIQKFTNRLAEQRAAATVHSVTGILNQVMKFAVRRGRIAVNPCSAVERPTNARRIEIHPLTHSQVRELADAMPTPQDRLAVLMAAYLGVRAGELWGLKPGDFDLLHGEVLVERSIKEVMQRHSERLPQGHLRLSPSLIVGPTKTKRKRRLSIPNFLADEIEALLPATEFFFMTLNGLPVRHTNFTKRVWLPYRPTNFSGLRWHDLRHTCASLLIAQGEHPMTVKLHMGHSDIATTIDVYGHLFPSTQQAMAAKLDAAWRESADGANVRQLGSSV